VRSHPSSGIRGCHSRAAPVALGLGGAPPDGGGGSGSSRCLFCIRISLSSSLSTCTSSCLASCSAYHLASHSLCSLALSSSAHAALPAVAVAGVGVVIAAAAAAVAATTATEVAAAAASAAAVAAVASGGPQVGRGLECAWVGCPCLPLSAEHLRFLFRWMPLRTCGVVPAALVGVGGPITVL
jgi:hypothetical protein